MLICHWKTEKSADKNWSQGSFCKGRFFFREFIGLDLYSPQISGNPQLYLNCLCVWPLLLENSYRCFFFFSQCLCTMKLRNAAVQECTSKHAVSHSIYILITPQFGIKNQKKPHIWVNLFLRLVSNKSVKSLALHHIPEGRTELLCDKCS